MSGRADVVHGGAAGGVLAAAELSVVAPRPEVCRAGSDPYLVVGPANMAGQGWAWARRWAVRRRGADRGRRPAPRRPAAVPGRPVSPARRAGSPPACTLPCGGMWRHRPRTCSWSPGCR
ncbi:hypothetical protein ACU686_07275 [Yinghuangia aomiensis]